jgi:ribosomal protein S18 acetylase RimI-like enzyme
MMQIEIVPMTSEEETKGKAYVHCMAWKEAYRGLLNQDFLDTRTLELSEGMALRAYHTGISTLLAKDGHEVIGFADYGPYRENDKRNAGEVYAIYLLNDYYDRGVGATLMRAALQAMPSYDEVIVWVLVGNERAIRLYEHFGFRFDGKSQVLDLGGKVTELRMVLDGSPKAK